MNKKPAPVKTTLVLSEAVDLLVAELRCKKEDAQDLLDARYEMVRSKTSRPANQMAR